MHPNQIIVVEPDPVVITFAQSEYYAAWFSGGTFMLEAENGAPQLASGDDLISGRQSDFIEIDVEGMEMRVRKGLHRVICEQRPGETKTKQNSGWQSQKFLLGEEI
jgi:hypothetical protein